MLFRVVNPSESKSSGRRVLIFGGGRGIGAEVARGFRAAGDEVVIVARSPAQVEATAREIGARGLTGDVGDAASVDAVFAQAGAVDVVVCAAAVQGGEGAIRPVWETDPEAFAAVAQINFLGSYHVLRAAIRSMQARESGGAVILFSGGGAAAPRPQFAAYGTTKTAVLRLVETAAAELALIDSPIRVFALAPGAVRTAMTEEVLALGAAAGTAEADAAAKIDAGDGVSPVMAAALSRFLASADAAPLTGRLIHVKEPYREYVSEALSEEAGCLRRAGYR